jgi:hypothetical protein
MQGDLEGNYDLAVTRQDSRRNAVPFDPGTSSAWRGAEAIWEETFRDIHRRHHWAGSASPSGAGAAEEQTTRLRTELPRLLADLGVRTLLDLPCGDYSWMATIELPMERYMGADLLPELIAPLQQHHGNARRQFTVFSAAIASSISPRPTSARPSGAWFKAAFPTSSRRPFLTAPKTRTS